MGALGALQAAGSDDCKKDCRDYQRACLKAHSQSCQNSMRYCSGSCRQPERTGSTSIDKRTSSTLRGTAALSSKWTHSLEDNDFEFYAVAFNQTISTKLGSFWRGA